MRRFVMVTAALLGALIGGLLSLKSERVANNLRGRLERLVTAELGLTTRIAKLEFELFPPAVIIEGITVSPQSDSEPVLAVHRARVGAMVWLSATGAWVLDRVEVDGVSAHLDLDRVSSLLDKRPQGSGPSVDIRHLMLWNVGFRVERPGFSAEVARTDFTIVPSDSGRAIELRVGSGRAEAGGEKLSFETTVRASLDGSLDSPSRLTIDSAAVFLDELRLEGSGGVNFAGEPDLNLRLAGSTTLQHLHELINAVPAAKGTLRFAVTARGAPQKQQARIEVALRDVAVGPRVLGDLDVDATLNPQRLRIESLSLRTPVVGELTGSGVIELGEGMPVDLRARLHSVSLPGLLAVSGLPDAWVRASIGADVDARGRLAPFGLTCKVKSGVIEGFAALNRSYRAEDAVSSLDLGPTLLEAEVVVDTKAVTITRAELTRGTSPLSVSGTLSFDREAGLALHVNSDAMALGELGPITGVLFEGSGQVAGVVEGPYNDPTVSATAAIDSLAVGGYPVGDTRATVIYSNLVLQVDRAQGRRSGGTFSGKGQIDFRGETPTTEARLELADVPLSDLLDTAGMPAEQARRFDARLTGAITASGSLLAPEGRFELAGPSLRISRGELGALHLSGGYGEARRSVYGSVTTRSGAGAITASAELDYDGHLFIDGQLDSIGFGALTPLMGDIDLRGTLSATIHLEGEARSLSGRIDASVPDFVAFSTVLGVTRATGKVDSGIIATSATVLDGKGRLDGKILLTQKLPYEMTGRFSELALATLWPALVGVDVAVGGSLVSRGEMVEAQSIVADIDLDRGHAALGGIVLEPERPIRLRFAKLDLSIVELLLAGYGIRATATGHTAVDGSAMDVKLLAMGELEAARVVLPRLQVARGSFDTRLSLTGTWAEPNIVGESSVRDGVLRLGDSRQTLEQLNARVLLTGRSLEIESARGVMGGGNVELLGQVLFPQAGETTVNLRTEFSGVSLRMSPQLQLAGSGFLSLSGEKDNLVLAGDVTVESLRYNANLDLERLIPRRQAPPLKVPAFDTSKAIRLAVHVAAPGNLLVTSNVLEAELTAELTLTGTTERMGAIGSISPLWARARYQDNVFTVERASVLFTEEYRLFTQFELRAHTAACGMQISVDVHGNSDGYNVIPTAEEEGGVVAAQDVLSCLQFGVRMRDLRNDSNSTLADALPSSIDALWNVSGLDSQVRRVFPMVDEFRLSSGWSARSKRSTPRVVLGKELGKDMQLTYARALDTENEQQLSVEYRLNQLATVQGTWNSASDVQLGDFGLDLRLRWEFR